MLGEELFVPMEFLRREISNKNIFDSKTEIFAKKLVQEASSISKDRADEMLKEVKEYCEHASTWMLEFQQKKRDQTEAITKLPQWGLDVSELFLKVL